MPLFISHRDSGLIKTINREIVQRIISMEVALYKISNTLSQTNIYGESINKVVSDPVRMFAIIEQGDKTSSTESVIEFDKSFKFAFIKQELEEKNIVIDEGDFIEFDSKYFEVDMVSLSNYWGGKNPNTDLNVKLDSHSITGYDYAVTVEAHLTSQSIFIARDNSIEQINNKRN